MPGQFKNTGTNPGGKVSLINSNNAGGLQFNAPGVGPTTSTTTSTTTLATYTIGQAALGGIIAYINGGGSTGTSGLVVTANDLGPAEWGCNGTNLPGATGTAIGTGYQNTLDIVANCATAGIAARLCIDLVEGGYSDWYLPSKDELAQLYINRVAIGGIGDNYYWSSSETAANFAYDLDFVYGTIQTTLKTDEDYVRAFRSF